MSQNYIFPLSVNTGGNGETPEIPDLSDYQKLLEGTEGQFVSFDENGNAVAIDVDHTYASFTNTDVTDLNNLKTPGFYNFSGTITNAPTYVDRFTVEVFTYYRYVVQRVFGFKASTNASATMSTPSYYVRMYDTMLYSWTSWSVVNKLTADGALSSTSTNPIQNKVVYNELLKKQDELSGTEGQLVGFDADGNAIAVEGLPVRAFAGSSSNDERIEITTTSLKIAKPFRKAVIQLSSTLPSTGSSGNNGGTIKVEIYRLADGSYSSIGQSSPVIRPVSANKIRVFNFTVSATVSDDGSVAMSAGGGYVDIDIANATTSNSGSGGASGNFANVLVWF